MLNNIFTATAITLVATLSAFALAPVAFAASVNEQGQVCQTVWTDTDGDGIGDTRTIICY